MIENLFFVLEVYLMLLIIKPLVQLCLFKNHVTFLMELLILKRRVANYTKSFLKSNDMDDVDNFLSPVTYFRDVIFLGATLVTLYFLYSSLLIRIIITNGCYANIHIMYINRFFL